MCVKSSRFNLSLLAVLNDFKLLFSRRELLKLKLVSGEQRRFSLFSVDNHPLLLPQPSLPLDYNGQHLCAPLRTHPQDQSPHSKSPPVRILTSTLPLPDLPGLSLLASSRTSDSVVERILHEPRLASGDPAIQGE